MRIPYHYFDTSPSDYGYELEECLKEGTPTVAPGEETLPIGTNAKACEVVEELIATTPKNRLYPLLYDGIADGDWHKYFPLVAELVPSMVNYFRYHGDKKKTDFLIKLDNIK